MSVASTLIAPGEVMAEDRKSSASQRVMFRVTNLYGFSRTGLTVRLGDDFSIESGELFSYLDPQAPKDANLGMVDFESGTLWVKYGFQIVCPRFYDLVDQGVLEPEMLNPLRVLNTEECVLKDDYSGWDARGFTETLPGSPLMGIGGG